MFDFSKSKVFSQEYIYFMTALSFVSGEWYKKIYFMDDEKAYGNERPWFYFQLCENKMINSGNVYTCHNDSSNYFFCHSSKKKTEM